MALLGEITLLSGQLITPKSPYRGISYAAQTPWLRHQSIKDNILFGEQYEEGRYKEVLACCALNPDLRVLEDGDETEIGQRRVFSLFLFLFVEGLVNCRGVSISGGQKARVALARAVYGRTKYLLLDDPFSAIASFSCSLEWK